MYNSRRTTDTAEVTRMVNRPELELRLSTFSPHVHPSSGLLSSGDDVSFCVFAPCGARVVYDTCRASSHIQVGHSVVQLLETLRYNPEGRGFYTRWCHCNFSLTYSFRPHYGPRVDSASNRNEYQEYFLGVKAAGA